MVKGRELHCIHVEMGVLFYCCGTDICVEYFSFSFDIKFQVLVHDTRTLPHTLTPLCVFECECDGLIARRQICLQSRDKTRLGC